MVRQTFDLENYYQKARRIRNQTSKVLVKWGLIPRFKRWRLSKDPDTGLIVLFGVLNKKLIDKQTSILFNNYFDQRLLYDLSNELQVQVLSCTSDSMHYAFILNRGDIDLLPTQIDVPILNENRFPPVLIQEWSVLEVVEGRIGFEYPNAAEKITGDRS